MPLLRIVRPERRGLVVELATRGDRWLYDSNLVTLLCDHASDRAIAALLTDRLGAFPSVVPIETALRICACTGADAAPWLPMFVHALFTAAKDSRTELMQLVDRVVPDLHRAVGPTIVFKVLGSVHEICKWWP